MFAAKVYKVASSKRVLPPGLIWSVNIGTDIPPSFFQQALSFASINVVCVPTSGGSPRSLVCLLQELKLAASGWTYLSLSVNLKKSYLISEVANK